MWLFADAKLAENSVEHLVGVDSSHDSAKFIESRADFCRNQFVTIADSQLTTLCCALVMFWLGAGPIRGFAVTLTIGICTSIFASVTVVRLLISFWLRSATKSRRAIEVPV